MGELPGLCRVQRGHEATVCVLNSTNWLKDTFIPWSTQMMYAGTLEGARHGPIIRQRPASEAGRGYFTTLRIPVTHAGIVYRRSQRTTRKSSTQKLDLGFIRSPSVFTHIFYPPRSGS